MNFKKIMILFLFFLPGCNLYGIPDESFLGEVEISVNKEIFDKGGKGLVIIDGQNNASTASLKVSNYFVYENEKGESFKLRSGGTPQEYMLSPGKYTLKDFYIYGGYSAGNTHVSVYIDFGSEIESSFIVNPGEVVYLGKVALKITSVKTSGFDRFFNKGASRKHIEYETNIFNEYKEIPSSYLASIKEKTGKVPTIKIMTWKRLGEKQ